MAEKPVSLDSARSALSLDEFIEVAAGAALRASMKLSKSPGEHRLPWPIWVGITIGDRGDIRQVGELKDQ
jgi:hypothetical protein